MKVKKKENESSVEKKIHKKKLEQIKRRKGKIPTKRNLKSQTEYSTNWKAFLAEQATSSKVEKENKLNPRKYPHFKRRNGEDIVKSKNKENIKSVIWFDDVDPVLIEKECGINLRKHKKVENVEEEDKSVTDDPAAMTKYVALDCEMVGIGYEGKEHALARVSIVNSSGQCIYDKYVKPAEKIIDYRTHVSGIRPIDLKDAPSYQNVQKEVADILKGRILVGHALHNDLKVLLLSHPYKQIRDTAKYKPFKKLLKTNRPALRKLAAEILKVTIQSGEHSSVIDARTTMKIYKLYSKEWEKSLRSKSKRSKVKIFVGNKEEGQKNNRKRYLSKKRHQKEKE